MRAQADVVSCALVVDDESGLIAIYAAVEGLPPIDWSLAYGLQVSMFGVTTLLTMASVDPRL